VFVLQHFNFISSSHAAFAFGAEPRLTLFRQTKIRANDEMLQRLPERW
jgi:hypothetical protein